MAEAIRRLPTPWNWAAARWPRPYSGLTGQVPLRTGLTMVDQTSWVYVLNVISRGCLWKIDIWVLPALLQCLQGWGSACQCSDHTLHTASNWSAWLSSQKEASSKDDVEESPQTVCWRQSRLKAVPAVQTIRVPYYEKCVVSGVCIYKQYLHGLCSPPTGKTVFLQAVQILLLLLRKERSCFLFSVSCFLFYLVSNSPLRSFLAHVCFVHHCGCLPLPNVSHYPLFSCAYIVCAPCFRC